MTSRTTTTGGIRVSGASQGRQPKVNPFLVTIRTTGRTSSPRRPVNLPSSGCGRVHARLRRSPGDSAWNSASERFVRSERTQKVGDFRGRCQSRERGCRSCGTPRRMNGRPLTRAHSLKRKVLPPNSASDRSPGNWPAGSCVSRSAGSDSDMARTQLIGRQSN